MTLDGRGFTLHHIIAVGHDKIRLSNLCITIVEIFAARANFLTVTHRGSMITFGDLVQFSYFLNWIYSTLLAFLTLTAPLPLTFIPPSSSRLNIICTGETVPQFLPVADGPWIEPNNTPTRTDQSFGALPTICQTSNAKRQQSKKSSSSGELVKHNPVTCFNRHLSLSYSFAQRVEVPAAYRASL
jgi:hypothetical protein